MDNYEKLTGELFRRFNAKCLWSEKGPKDTRVERIEAFACLGRVIIAQKYRDGGWELYAPVSDSIDFETNLQALENRLSINPDIRATVRTYLEEVGHTVNALHNAQLPDGSHPCRRFAAELTKAVEPLSQFVEGDPT